MSFSLISPLMSYISLSELGATRHQVAVSGCMEMLRNNSYFCFTLSNKLFYFSFLIEFLVSPWISRESWNIRSLKLPSLFLLNWGSHPSPPSHCLSQVNDVFSVFAGLTILWNLVLMLSWVPAWLVLHHDLLVVKLSAKLPSLPLTLGKASHWLHIKSSVWKLYLEFIFPRQTGASHYVIKLANEIQQIALLKTYQAFSES